MASGTPPQDASVLSSLNLDFLYLVSSRTILSPFFAFWVPVLLLCHRGITTSSPSFIFSVRWLYFTVFRFLLIQSSRVWRNRSWKGGWREVIGGRRTEWEEQRVVVTGGAEGLGRALVDTLCVRGVEVVVLDVKPWKGDEDDVHYYQCDVSDPKAVAEVAERIREDVGDPTILINNAGIVQGKLIIDLEPQEVQKTFGVNAVSHFYLLKEFLPAMIQAKTGHIVSIASVLGTIGCPQVADYSASKAAVTSLHEALRYELDARHGCPDIRTTLVSPGLLQTNLFASIAPQNQFFLPTVSPHDLVKKIIQALDTHESREIWEPLYTNYAWILRGLPSWMRDGAQCLTGAGRAMAPFRRKRD